MKYLGLKTFSSFLFVSVLVSADPFLTFKFDKFEVTKQVENPYIANLQGFVTKIGKHTALTAGLDVMELPPDMQGTVKITLNGIPLPPISGNICDLLDNNILVKAVAATAEPNNRLDKGCPVAPGNYILKNYVVDTKSIPLGLVPDGKFSLVTTVGMPGEESLAAYKLTGSASHFGL